MGNISTGVLRPVSLRRPSTAAALGLTAALLSSPALAQQAPPADDKEVELETLKIEDRTADVSPYSQKGAPYKARVSGDGRHTRPLAETPQTIQVLTQSQIIQSGLTDLRSILKAQAGITIGTGENGNAFGDRYIIRGQEAKSDVFVDGLRDPGMTIRESFAVEQIEITKGPNSTFAGRGSSGGAINSITKQAATDYNFGRVAVGVGTDRYVRTTADTNLAINEKLAVRLNGLYAYQRVPDRSPADRTRYGLAASALFRPTEALSLTLDYYGFHGHDNPDLGGYLTTNPSTGERRPTLNLPSYVQDEDFLKSNVDTVTGRLRYQVSDAIYFTNIARYGRSTNRYVTTGISGRTTGTGNPLGVYATSTLDNGHTGYQEVRYVADQANLHFDHDLLGGRNQFILGFEYTNHKVDTNSYTRTAQGAFNCSLTTSTTLNAYCITGPTGSAVANINNLAQRTWVLNPYFSRKWQVESWSVTAMDTVDLTPKLTLFLGGRYDHYDYSLGTYNQTTGAITIASGQPYQYSGGLWNGHAGLTYKIGPAVLYASASTAQDINGGESDTGTSSGYGGLVIFNGQAAGAKPERSVNYEAGVKFDLFNGDLLLTAAAFNNTKSDVMEGADYAAVGTFNTGKFRVRGLEFEVAGNLTDRWSVQGGISYMKARVLESSNTGISAAQLALGATNLGKTLANFANLSGSLQTRLQVTDAFAMGAAISYKGRRYGGQPDTAAVFSNTAANMFTYSQPTPAYAIGDLFFEYKFSNAINLRVNVTNVTNQNYYDAVYRAGFFLYQGDKRRVFGTLELKF